MRRKVGSGFVSALLFASLAPAQAARELEGVESATVSIETARSCVTVGWPGRFDWGAGERVDQQVLADRVAGYVGAVCAEFDALFGAALDEPEVEQGGTTADDAELQRRDGRSGLRLVLLRDGDDARRVARKMVGIELHGLAVLGLDGRNAAVLRLDAKEVGEGDALRGLLGHVVARLLLAQRLGSSPGEAGHGWIEAGVAARFEARAGVEQAEGMRPNLFVGFGERVWRPETTYGRGDWAVAAREQLESGRLPVLADLLGLPPEEMDLEAWAAARAFVEFLLVEERGGERLLEVARRVVAGEAALEVLAAVYPGDEPLEQRFHDWLRAG